MHHALAPGLTHTQTLEMSDRLIMSAMPDTGAMPVFSTAFAVGLIEWACMEAIRPYLEAGEQTIGSHVYLTHAAPARISRQLTAVAELVEVKGTALRFRVDCYDECDQIGSGFHERQLIAPSGPGTAEAGRAARFHA